MVTADFVRRYNIPIERRDESILGDGKTSPYQVDGYFVANWKVQGSHDPRPGIFAVVANSQASSAEIGNNWRIVGRWHDSFMLF